MGTSLVLRYFKEKRDINIHVGPLNLPATYDVRLHETIHVTETLTIKVTRADGSVEAEFTTPPEPPTPGPAALPADSVTLTYYFDDWRPDSVVAVSQQYLGEIEALLSEGMAAGYFTD
jgi:hypothetical protein